MICIYHNKDLDGFCSGAIVKLKYPDAKMIGYDYGQPLEIDVTGEPIIMVDVSVPMSLMMKLSQMSNHQLTWIDHHASAIKDYNEYIEQYAQGNEDAIKMFCTAVLQDGISACEGAWNYLFPLEIMPEAVKILGEYDTWRNKDKERWDNIIMPFQYGMRMICSSPETFPENLFKWFSVDIDSIVKSITHDGAIILEYQKVQNERTCKYSFETQFEGLRAICLNSGGANSQLFASVYDENKHDLMIPFFYSGHGWTFSLYTTKKDIDCSVIAKSKGGGGHKQAAGFKTVELPNEFKIEKP